MSYSLSIGQTLYRFDRLKDLLAKGTPELSGDQSAGISADGPVARFAAQMALADVSLRAFVE